MERRLTDVSSFVAGCRFLCIMGIYDYFWWLGIYRMDDEEMKIALVTNWGTRCAVAEYAKSLADNCLLTKGVEFKIVTGELNYEGIMSHLDDVDVIHFNYCAHVFNQITSDEWYKFRQTGKPVILTFHESCDWKTRKIAESGIADWVVVHDRIRDGAPAPINVQHIPFGVPYVNLDGIPDVGWKGVGTFGCAFPWKGLYPLAWACGQLAVGLRAILSEPDSDKGHMDWEKVKASILQACPHAQITTEWQTEEQIVRQLASCAVIALPFDPAAPIQGISSSVRMAIAAQRPLVLTRFAHFSDLYDYEDEVYFADGNLKIEILRAFQHLTETRPSRTGARIPKRALRDMSWSNSAKLYCNLYAQALQSKVSFTKEEVHA